MTFHEEMKKWKEALTEIDWPNYPEENKTMTAAEMIAELDRLDGGGCGGAEGVRGLEGPQNSLCRLLVFNLADHDPDPKASPEGR